MYDKSVDGQEEAHVPLSEKYALDLNQAPEYFGISAFKIRKMIRDNPYADFILMNGNKVLIKRKKFEAYLDTIYSI
ncbi:MAG: hypothetical protein LUG62_09585 [Clostridiales bacterium]|nr:hypothetical protein [Clostridiales bacterium]